MDKGDGQEIELERELDQLYRKVAGDAPPEIPPKRKETVVDLRTSAAAGPRPVAPAAERTARGKKRAPFRIAPLAWGLLYAAFALALALAVFFFLAPVDRHPAVALEGGDGSPVKSRPTGEGATLKDKDGRRYPLPPEAIIVTIEEAKEPDRGRGDAGPHDADAPRGRPQGSYGVQIRAYPGNQAQNAIAFLAELRRKYPDAVLETVSIAERGIWHRILLGDFLSEEEADNDRQRRGLARDYPNSFIQKKSGAPREPKSH
jgi:hypothetical protein